MRDLRELIRPNLLGLKREDVRVSTWSWGVRTVLAGWALLGTGLLVALAFRLLGSGEPALPWLLGAWLALVPLLGVSGAMFFGSLTRDGWTRRGWFWRTGALLGLVGLTAMTSLFVVLFARLIWQVA